MFLAYIGGGQLFVLDDDCHSDGKGIDGLNDIGSGADQGPDGADISAETVKEGGGTPNITGAEVKAACGLYIGGV